jgi:hypothetical protein
MFLAVPFSSSALPASFLMVLWAYGLVVMFFAPGLFLGVIVGIGSRFHVLCSQTRFGRFREHQVLFSCLALPDSFRAVPSAPGRVFIFHAPGLVSGGTVGVRYCFQVLRSPDSFSLVPRASGLVFIFCSTGLFLGGIEVVGARIQVLRSRTYFQLYRGHRGSFSCLALPDYFLAVPRPSWLVFMFCDPGHVFAGTEGIGYHFQVLRSQTCFQLPRASGPIFMLCAPGRFLGVTEGVVSRFHVLHSRTHYGRYRRHRVPFSSFALHDSFSTVPRARASELVFMFCGI